MSKRNRDWGGWYAPYIALAVMLLLFVIGVGYVVTKNAQARSPGILVCALDGKETLRVRIAEGWQGDSGHYWFYTPHGGRPTTYWPVGGESCLIERSAQ